MNFLAAKTLSTIKCARHRVMHGGGIFAAVAYLLQVRDLDVAPDEKLSLRLEIYGIERLEPPRGSGQTIACVAQTPHLARDFSLDEFKAFCAERGFDLEDGWYPGETDDNLFTAREANAKKTAAAHV